MDLDFFVITMPEYDSLWPADGPPAYAGAGLGPQTNRIKAGDTTSPEPTR